MSLLGTSLEVGDEFVGKCERFTCLLYQSKTHISVNDLRYDMFCAKASQSSQLPPTQDALRKHVQRANYQAAVWLHALVPSPDIPGPDGHGWRVSNDEIFIDWMDQQPAPAELLQLVSCGCQTGCTTGRCSCARAGLQCTDACTCTNCSS